MEEFTEAIWAYYTHNKRDLPWRQAENGEYDAYKILLSEIMLQQTGVQRVIPKYEMFLRKFPHLQALATGTLADVLVLWSGLGYNRRARYVHEAAKYLVTKEEPWTVERLIGAPGIGSNTAKAICVYAYNQPQVFIETNIRSVIIYHFFTDRSDVPDSDITHIMTGVIAALSPDEYREFYWALMDYGSHLKRTVGNHARNSKHYTRQSSFVGSRRHVRGLVLKMLTHGSQSRTNLEAEINDERLLDVLAELQYEGLISYVNGCYCLGT